MHLRSQLLAISCLLACTSLASAQQILKGDAARGVHDKIHNDELIKKTKSSFENALTKAVEHQKPVEVQRTVCEVQCIVEERCESYGLFGRKKRTVLVTREVVVSKVVTETKMVKTLETVKYQFSFPAGKYGEAAIVDQSIGSVPDSAGAKAKLLKILLDTKIVNLPAHTQPGELNGKEAVLSENTDFTLYKTGTNADRICRFQVSIKIEGDKDEKLTMSVRVMEKVQGELSSDKINLDNLAEQFLQNIIKNVVKP